MKKKQLRKIKCDVPYIDLSDVFEGEISEVAEKVLAIRERLVERWEQLGGYDVSNENPNNWKYINIVRDYWEEGFQYRIEVYRDETDDEYKKRLSDEKLLAAILEEKKLKQKNSQQKREIAILKRLAKKYDITKI